jgi:hypothetical protein
MNDIEDRLRADGTAWQQLVDAGAEATTRPAPKARRLRWIAPALTAAALVGIGVTLALVTLRGSDRPAPSGAKHWSTHTFGALTLRYPASWHALNPTSTELGPVSHLGYLVSTQ